MTNDEQAERDRRVGAAVMAWECVSCGAHAVVPPGKLPHSCGYCLRTLRDAVAAALREEAGR